ncbi:MAG: PhzF family phenazine biosynthesis protein [Bacteroidetes bacterium]|nr:MAG: PhzF family phenazine biosynthesis protein [Bacteroidota bacterium]
MTLPIYQIDAFTQQPFGGNPAAVVPLTAWLPTALMQQIAEENNLSETVFFVPMASQNATGPHLAAYAQGPTPHYHIRWFTPRQEINLCGHATLATAYALFHHLGHQGSSILFHSQSGPLQVTLMPNGSLQMDFPAWMPTPLDAVPAHLVEALGGAEVLSVHQHRDLLVELPSQQAVQDCSPNFFLMQQHFKYIIITAAGTTVDFVSRFFAPTDGINEDPVTGSAHAQLIPFWAQRLQKTNLVATQLSARQGQLWCSHQGSRVIISGHAVLYSQGQLYLPA